MRLSCSVTLTTIQTHSQHTIFVIVNSRTKYFIARQQCTGNPCDISMTTMNIFILLTAAAAPTTTKRKRTVTFPWLQWLRHTVKLYPHCLSYSNSVLFDSRFFVSGLVLIQCEVSEAITIFLMIIIILWNMRV